MSMCAPPIAPPVSRATTQPCAGVEQSARMKMRDPNGITRRSTAALFQ
jgi:hypothetical protein